VFVPPQAANGKVPVVTFLSGLTCTEENFMVKSGAQKFAAELGIMLVSPDTSPRGKGVPDDPDDDYDFGLAAGFYLNATEEPWSKHYHMYDYVTAELPAAVKDNLAIDPERMAISGHSMGGHGALTIALKNPGAYRSVSAFSPIVAPSQVPWGKKALGGYLGDDTTVWAAYDACALVATAEEKLPLLVDQGDADNFLDEQLKPHLLQDACDAAGHPLTLRMQPGYDHSYFFIASFIGDHIAHHAKALKG
ncbi:MAG: S-formylglutathione hydrolase, partial [Hyphomicrobiaceae bacterium]